MEKKASLQKDNELTFNFFDVNGGDAIWIRYLGNDQYWHNILIDGGYGKSYSSTFYPVLKAIKEARECVDLWIITHIDLDHIGAIIGFIQDKSFTDKNTFVKSYWFNHANYPLPDFSGKIGFKQGIKLREYLGNFHQLTLERISEETPVKHLFGLELTVLSPTMEKLLAADADWITRESKGKISNAKGDHDKTIEELTSATFIPDDDLANGSSISFLLQFKNVRALFLADSHPLDIEASLNRPPFDKKTPLDLNFVKLSHHGSKGNTSVGMLNKINTKQFVITANGITNKHPDKETLVRILTNRQENNIPTEFVFASNTQNVKKIFSVDKNASERYKFTCDYIPEGKNFISLNFLPIQTNE